MKKDTDFDIDARQAEIIGKPQRIASLTREEFDDEAKAMVVALRAELGLQTDKIKAHAVRLQASAVSAERGQVKSEHVHDRSDLRRDVPVLTYPGLACGTRPREC